MKLLATVRSLTSTTYLSTSDPEFTPTDVKLEVGGVQLTMKEQLWISAPTLRTYPGTTLSLNSLEGIQLLVFPHELILTLNV
jgi:hypothetical protein